MIWTVLEYLSEGDRVDALSTKDDKGLTPAHIVGAKQSLGILARLLRPLTNEEKLNALETDGRLEPKVAHIRDWFKQQLKDSRYPLLVPPKQQVEDSGYPLLVPPEILIFFNEKDRELKSKEEAESFESMFSYLGFHPEGFHPEGFHPGGFHPEGFHPEVTKDFTEKELLGIMSHGSRGLICDMENEVIRINGLITRMAGGKELEDIPKMIPLQCCQSVPRVTEEILEIQEIAPRFRDFSVMVSAVSGEKRERDVVFIPLLGKHFREAKDDDDVDWIFRQTGKSMKKKPDQTPIDTHTLNSRLALKRVYKPS